MTLHQTPRDDFAIALRGFGPVGILAILVILASNLVTVLLSAVLVLLWARRSGTRWREIGYMRPTSWIGSLTLGVVFGVVFKLVMKIIVMPLLGADPINHAYHYLVGNRAALPGILFTLIVGAGVGEETVYRGYMFERLGKLFGSSAIAKTSIVLLTAAIFALAHYSVQGLAGSEQAMITGTVFGVIFVVTGSLWLPMCAHVAFDLTALAIIYWDLETAVAHLVFK
jgi:membrane protease YdiL (CAAX protease family)